MARILIVDDARFMRDVIRGILKANGFDDILEADDGLTAVQTFEKERPDVIILDITMPNMDGLETLLRIKEIDRAAKIVMCSAIGQEKQMMRAIAHGATDYLVKPFTPESIVRVIRNIVGQ